MKPNNLILSYRRKGCYTTTYTLRRGALRLRGVVLSGRDFAKLLISAVITPNKFLPPNSTTNAATQPQTTLMFPLLAVASVGALMGPRCVPAQAPRCVTAQAPRTMGPVAGIQLTPDEQWDIQQEISNLNMRLLSVEKSTEILAVNTNRTNAMVKLNMERNLKRNYDDVSRSPLLSPVLRARLATTDPLS